MDTAIYKRLEQISEEIKKLNFTHDQAAIMCDTLITLKGLLHSVIESSDSSFQSVEGLKDVMRAMYAYIHVALSNAQPEE